MPTRSASAVWEGNLEKGRGTVKLGSGAFEGSYSFLSRFKDGEGTNPEELIGAAHAGCYSMALAHILAEEGHSPNSIKFHTQHLQLDSLPPQAACGGQWFLSNYPEIH